jgi:hypothetical protein
MLSPPRGSSSKKNILATFGDLPKEARALAKASFYFGNMAMLYMVESVVDQAKSHESIVRVLQGFREEIDETMERSAVRVN